VNTRLLNASLLVAVFAACVGAGPAMAQTEADLRNAFEGKSLAPTRDMPGTKEGVEIDLQRKPPVNMDDWTKDVRKYGVAVAAGRPALVTLIKVKGKVIEFQFEGGGASPNTCWSLPDVATKSTREAELDAKTQKTSGEQAELDKLAKERADKDAKSKKDNDAVVQACKERAATERKSGGSRFNIHYAANPPRPISHRTPSEGACRVHRLSPAAGGTTGRPQPPARPRPRADEETRRDDQSEVREGCDRRGDRIWSLSGPALRRDRQSCRPPGTTEATDVKVLLQWLPGEWCRRSPRIGGREVGPRRDAVPGMRALS
jgi:hypothetical protein